MDDRHARLQTLIETISLLDDTNLAHRGGLTGLRFAQAQAQAFLRAGGAARPDALAHAQAIHQAFVARRLSPGGAADVLAAAGFVERICRPA
jgi:triphosphoribosyl-dephospho-CoA synthase